MNSMENNETSGGVPRGTQMKMRTKIISIVLLVVLVAVSCVVYSKTMYTPKRTSTLPISTMPENVPATNQFPIGKVVKEGASGKEYISNELILGFKQGVSNQDMLNVIEGVGGKEMQHFTNVPLFLIYIPDTGDGAATLRAIEKLKKDSRVDDATLNYLTSPSPSRGN